MPEIRLKPETVALLKRRALKRRTGLGCFLCSRILESLGPERMLRPWPPRAESADFPVEAQGKHVKLEVACG